MNALTLFHNFLALPAIIGSLPNTIATGQAVDATPLMADLNFIVSQVNANAQPITTTPTAIEWQPLGQTPTFISTTSFSVPGNLTSVLAVGRRVQTQNTGGLIYSTISASVFGVVTTVTLINDSGVLDSGLSVVNYGMLNATNRSVPYGTRVLVNRNATQAITGGVETTVLFNTVFQDALTEFSTGTGKITLKQSGLYYSNFAAGTSVAQQTTVALRVNGLNISVMFPANSNGTTTSDLACSGFYFGGVGDILEMRVFGAAGWTLGGGSGTFPIWQFFRVQG